MVQDELFSFEPPPKQTSLREMFLELFNRTSLQNPECVSQDNEQESLDLINRICDAAAGLLKDDKPVKTGILVNSSTGKDSTLLTQLVLRAVTRRRKAGLSVIPIMVGISDTGSEFPAMAKRMQDEADAINAYAQKTGTDIEAVIVRPRARNRLLPEILGRGLALPHLRSGTTNGLSGASWCMDRVKRSPLEGVLAEACRRFGFVIQCIGVRDDESGRRKGSIERHAGELPDGLTELGTAEGNRIGATPIRHWSDTELREWMNDFVPPWRPDSSDDLRAIYSSGSDPGTGGESGECQLTLAKDGKPTNVCSDLGGTRFGCWHCLLSQNRSLKNLARRDKSHEPLRNFHKYLFGHHARGENRRVLRDELGFSALRLFPKGFTLEERFKMTMLLLRAEAESGKPLLPPEDREAINRYWHLAGYPAITVDTAFSTMLRWKRTGKWKTGWETEDVFQAEGLHDAFPTPLPYTMWSHMDFPAGEIPRKPDPLQILGGSEIPSYLLPRMRTWLMCRPGNKHVLTIISDHPSVIAGKTQGLRLAPWTVQSHRSPLDWELELADGRSVFYFVDESNDAIRGLSNMEAARNITGTKKLMAAHLANSEERAAGGSCGDWTEEWTRDWRQREDTIASNPSMEDMRQLIRDLFTAKYESETVARAVTECKEMVSAWETRNGNIGVELPEDRMIGKKEYRLDKLRAGLRGILENPDVHKAARAIEDSKKLATRLIIEGTTKPGLLTRVADQLEWLGVDPDEFDRKMEEISNDLRKNPKRAYQRTKQDAA